MKRSQAEKLIDNIRVLAAAGPPHDVTFRDALADVLSDAGLTPLEYCTGEAHSNAFIDNCMVCAPRWGFIGARERVT